MNLEENIIKLSEEGKYPRAIADALVDSYSLDEIVETIQRLRREHKIKCHTGRMPRGDNRGIAIAMGIEIAKNGGELEDVIANVPKFTESAIRAFKKEKYHGHKPYKNGEPSPKTIKIIEEVLSGKSQSQVAREQGVSKQWVSQVLIEYRGKKND